MLVRRDCFFTAGLPLTPDPSPRKRGEGRKTYKQRANVPTLPTPTPSYLHSPRPGDVRPARKPTPGPARRALQTRDATFRSPLPTIESSCRPRPVSCRRATRPSASASAVRRRTAAALAPCRSSRPRPGGSGRTRSRMRADCRPAKRRDRPRPGLKLIWMNSPSLWHPAQATADFAGIRLTYLNHLILPEYCNQPAIGGKSHGPARFVATDQQRRRQFAQQLARRNREETGNLHALPVLPGQHVKLTARRKESQLHPRFAWCWRSNAPAVCRWTRHRCATDPPRLCP